MAPVPGHPSERKAPAKPKPKPKPKPAAKPVARKPASTSARKPTATASNKPKSTSKKKEAGKTEQEWAEYYGWSVALINSDPSLKKLFARAQKETWPKAKFVAELKRTSWYRKNGDSARQTIALKYTDPETWRNRVRAIYTNIQALAGQMGIKTSWKTMWDMAEDALMFGWDNAKLRSALSGYLKAGSVGGEAGEARNQLRQFAYQMGIKISDGTIDGWLKGILNGSKTVEDYKGYIQKQAISAFPTLAEDIKGGLMVRDIASPYMEAMGRILEVNSEELDLYDPTIRKALTSINGDTGKAESKPLWQFEEELRKDPRWLKTNNARESINGVAHQVLQSWGFAT
jgi:hypothetical protein